MSEIVVRRGTAVGILTPSTEEDFAYINANLRAMDKAEQDHFIRIGDLDRPDSVDKLEKAWTLHLCGEIVGYVGLQIPPMRSALANFRFIPMISTKNVDHHPIDYTRLSRPILDYVMSQAPRWVDYFLSAPLKKYGKSVNWHEKTMGWMRVGEYDAGGEVAVLFKIDRKES